MYSYSMNFFSKKKAENYKAELENMGIKNVSISRALDGFGQLQYRVEWNAEG